MPLLALLALAAAGIAELPPAPGRLARAAAHLAACAALVLLNLTTHAATARYTEVVTDAWRRNEPQVALHAARQALATSPGQPSMHRLLGNALERAGDPEGALAAYAAAAGLGPRPAEHVEILVDRSFTLQRLGRREEAYTAAEEALRLDPDAPRLPDTDPVIREMRSRMKAE
jgi:tetratricopeptide (TPR) repeat protein